MKHGTQRDNHSSPVVGTIKLNGFCKKFYCCHILALACLRVALY